MTVLADFLHAQRAAIIRRFTTRAKQTVAPITALDSEIVDHLPQLLDEIAIACRRDVRGAQGNPEVSQIAEEHGRQRLRVGYDLNAVVRDYGIFRDCILEMLEQAQVVVGLPELRTLLDCLSDATADSVNQYVGQRLEDLDADRHQLLGLFQQAPGFVCFLRGSALVVELANAAYFQLVGERDIVGKPVREALPELQAQGTFDLLDGVFASGQPFVGRGMRMVLQRRVHEPPTEAFIDVVYQPIRGADGLVMGILAQGTDMTEGKRLEGQHQAAEAALRASEERYRTLFESIDDGFCVMQLLFNQADEPVDYRFLETNAAFQRETGLVDAAGKTSLELVPTLDSSWFQRYGRVATTGESMRFESHAPAMGRWFDVYASRVGRPELRQVALVFKDVTERKRAEEERERLLARESSARHDAEEASRLKDEFVATVSHELRTPLTSMLGWVQLLRSGKLAVDKHERALETVERNARAQAQLIEDLLDVSRIQTGKLRLEVAPVEVQSVVEAALETVRPAADAKGLQLQPVLATAATVMGDHHRLQQVVWNLLSNAVKFTAKGGRVQVLVQCRDSSVEIIVGDTGQGIAKDFQPHVFERFRQLDGGTTRAHGGLGLGLSIVRQIVELHGGTVGVSSDGEGLGSSFTVRLPLAVTRRRPGAGSAFQQSMMEKGFVCPPELDGLGVLVVDDEEDTRELLRTLLEGCGARVRVAPSAAEGLRMFQAEPPGVLLSDIGMPDEDGYGFIEKIRKLPAAAGGETPAVALTAYARTEDRTRALLSGFSNHVLKPVEPLELLAVIASLSGRTRTRAV